MLCPACLVRDFAMDEAKDALIRHQFVQLHRLTGGTYEPPAPEELVTQPAAASAPTVDPLPVLERILGFEGVYRKPPRVAAPKLLTDLAEAGWTITHGGDRA